MDNQFLPPSIRERPGFTHAGYLRLGSQPDLSLRDFWRILQRRQRTVMASIAACLVLALVRS